MTILTLAGTIVIAAGEQYTRQLYRPLIGGIQIELIKWWRIFPVFDAYCTIGYVAKAPDNSLGVITAGHCSNFETGISVYQPAWSLLQNNYIGSPSWVAPSSSNNYFDVEFIPNSNVALAVLYASDTGASPISTGYYYDFYQVRDLLRTGPISVYKTGRTTGTTGGLITGAFDPLVVNLGGVTTSIRFALNTTLYSLGGDSGSPVFSVDRYVGAILFGHVIAGSANQDPNNPRTIAQSTQALLQYGYAPRTYWR
jgi:hypothetical protein